MEAPKVRDYIRVKDRKPEDAEQQTQGQEPDGDIPSDDWVPF
jgi:hypothetical protein